MLQKKITFANATLEVPLALLLARGRGSPLDFPFESSADRLSIKKPDVRVGLFYWRDVCIAVATVLQKARYLFRNFLNKSLAVNEPNNKLFISKSVKYFKLHLKILANIIITLEANTLFTSRDPILPNNNRTFL